MLCLISHLSITTQLQMAQNVVALLDMIQQSNILGGLRLLVPRHKLLKGLLEEEMLRGVVAESMYNR